jgi:hypothetical protein
MTILEMIEEWERGCSNTIGDHPIKCEECTIGLINAIKEHELKTQLEELKKEERRKAWNESKFEAFDNSSKLDGMEDTK